MRVSPAAAPKLNLAAIPTGERPRSSPVMTSAVR
jgi:hypothetical protein